MARRFSQRHGYKELPPQLKLEEVSELFRNGLQYAWSRHEVQYRSATPLAGAYLNGLGSDFAKRFWAEVLEDSIGKAPSDLDAFQRFFSSYIQKEPFYAIFDFCEFVAAEGNATFFRPFLEDLCRRSRLAYRFVEGQFIATGNEFESESVQHAFEQLQTAMPNARAHLVNSSRLLAEGDYAGSVRESANSLESVARQIGGTEKVSSALKSIQDEYSLHPALTTLMAKAYGYASNEEGARHALVNNETAVFEEAEALFILVVVSSSINYLLAKVE